MHVVRFEAVLMEMRVLRMAGSGVRGKRAELVRMLMWLEQGVGVRRTGMRVWI
jgi:hypothetical protein